MADGQHVDVVIAHILHDRQNLFVRFAQAHHQSAFGRYVWKELFEFFQQIQTEGVVATRPRFFVETGHGFHVVVHHIWWRGFQNFQSAVIAATKVRDQDFDLCTGRKLAGAANAIDKVLAATITQIVAVDAGDDHVVQFQRGDGFG